MGRLNDLLVYKKAFGLAMEIFNITKSFPPDEKYGLTSQIRRSSRSVCSNLAEGYRKRIYEPHFIAKLTDAYMENTETEVWIEFALKCKYIDAYIKEKLKNQNDEIGKILHYIIQNSKKFQ